jgi:uncharacterized membrane protein YphA (DoxX/SURF4 family)
MKKQISLEIICFAFILLFMYAALSKLADYEKFAVQIGQSPMLTSMAKFVAWFIPTIEIIVSILLAWPRFRLIGLFASFTLMIIFTSYIVAITQFSDYVPCSCGGILEKLGWKEHLVFNIIFDLLALAGIMLSSGTETSNEAVLKKTSIA